MAISDEKRQQMDDAASQAENAISADDLEAFRKVAEWWKVHVGRAGHRRLGRVLMKYDVVQAGVSQFRDEDPA